MTPSEGKQGVSSLVSGTITIFSIFQKKKKHTQNQELTKRKLTVKDYDCCFTGWASYIERCSLVDKRKTRQGTARLWSHLISAAVAPRPKLFDATALFCSTAAAL